MQYCKNNFILPLRLQSQHSEKGIQFYRETFYYFLNMLKICPEKDSLHALALVPCPQKSEFLS